MPDSLPFDCDPNCPACQRAAEKEPTMTRPRRRRPTCSTAGLAPARLPPGTLHAADICPYLTPEVIAYIVEQGGELMTLATTRSCDCGAPATILVMTSVRLCSGPPCPYDHAKMAENALDFVVRCVQKNGTLPTHFCCSPGWRTNPPRAELRLALLMED